MSCSSEKARNAASSLLAAINRLRSSAEYARSTEMRAEVEPFLVRAHELRDDLRRLAVRLEAAELRRRVERRQGRTA